MARILPAIVLAERGLFPGPVFLSIEALPSLQLSSSVVDQPTFSKVIVQVPTVIVLLFAGKDWTSMVRVALTSETFGVITVCVTVSELAPTATLAIVSLAVKIGVVAAKATGVSVENTIPKIKATEVTLQKLLF